MLLQDFYFHTKNEMGMQFKKRPRASIYEASWPLYLYCD